jgi:predicted metalloprotease with PDZ domain
VVIASVGFSMQAQNGKRIIVDVTQGSDAFRKKLEPGTEVLAIQDKVPIFF